MKVCAIDDINCYLLAKHLGPSVPETRDFVASHSLSRGKFCARLKAFREYFFSWLVAVDCSYVWVVLQGFFFDGGDIVGHASNRIVGILIVSVEPSACPWKTKREKHENSFRFLVQEERWTIIPYVHYWIACI